MINLSDSIARTVLFMNRLKNLDMMKIQLRNFRKPGSFILMS